jgi:hypothetical protein
VPPKLNFVIARLKEFSVNYKEGIPLANRHP